MMTVRTTALMVLITFGGAASLQSQVLTLKEAIRQALERNQTVLYSARQRYTQAQYRLAGSEVQYNPKLNFSFNTIRNYSRTKLFTSRSDISSYLTLDSKIFTPVLTLKRAIRTPFGSKTELGLAWQAEVYGSEKMSYRNIPQFTFSIDQPLGAAGMRTGHIDQFQARQNFTLAEMSYQLQQENLILAVIQSYFQLWQSFQDVERAKRDLESAKRVLEIARLRLKSGTVAEFEVLNAQIQHQMAADNWVVAQDKLQSPKIRFLQLLGEDLNTPVTLTQDIEIDTVDFALNDAIKTALSNRSEIKQAEIGLGLTALNVQTAARSSEPTLNLRGGFSLSSGDRENLEDIFFDLPNQGWSLQATLSLPILDGGASEHQKQIAQITFDVEKKNLELLKEDIAIEVEEIYRNLKLQQGRMETLKLNLEVAREALRIAEIRFEMGQISANEIELVRNRDNSAQNALTNAKISYLISRANLAKTMGTMKDWVEEKILE